MYGAVFEVHEGSGLVMTFYEGGKAYYRRSASGNFEWKRPGYNMFSSTRSGECSGLELASSVWEFFARRLHCTELESSDKAPISLLRNLGWHEVAERLEAINREFNSVESKLGRLRQELQSLEAFYTEHRNHDYWWWRSEIYERLKASPGAVDDEISVKRMHQEAQWRLAEIRRYEKLVLKIAALESALRSGTQDR